MRKCSDVGHSDPGGSSGDSELLDESQRRLRQDFLVSCEKKEKQSWITGMIEKENLQ